MSTCEDLVVRPLSPFHLDPRTVAGDVRRRTDRVATEAPPPSKPKSKDPENKPDRGNKRAGFGGTDDDGSDSDSESQKDYGLRDDGEVQVRKNHRKTISDPVIVPFDREAIENLSKHHLDSAAVVARRHMIKLQAIWQDFEVQKKKKCARENLAREPILVWSKLVTTSTEIESSQHQEHLAHMQKTTLVEGQKATDVAKRFGLSFTFTKSSIDEFDAMQELLPKVEEEVVALCIFESFGSIRTNSWSAHNYCFDPA